MSQVIGVAHKVRPAFQCRLFENGVLFPAGLPRETMLEAQQDVDDMARRHADATYIVFVGLTYLH